MKPLLPGTALLLALALVLPACRRPAGPTAGSAAPQVTVAIPLQKRLTEWDYFTGRLTAVAEVEVRARVSGYLESTHFKEGTEVKEGDLLFTIDSRRYQAEQDRATAELSRARTMLELATLEANRAAKLVESRSISLEESDAKSKARQGAEAALQAAQAAVESTRLEVEWTKVTAPIAGRIGRKLVTEGNLISGGVGTTTLLTTIVALDPIYCYFDVDERSALKYRELARQGKRPSALYGGIPAEMGLANETGYPHRGTIDFVDNVISPTTGAIRARGLFKNDDRLMAPGFFGRVRIPGSGEYEAMLIRDTATGSDQGRTFVYVVGADGKAMQRWVEMGPLEEGLRIVRAGLEPKDRVVINGVVSVRPGTAVQATETPMALPAPAAAATPAPAQP